MSLAIQAIFQNGLDIILGTMERTVTELALLDFRKGESKHDQIHGSGIVYLAGQPVCIDIQRR